jgi:hypothetical protein
MGFLNQAELNRLLPAETHAFAGRIPTQIVSARPTARSSA